MSQDGNKGSGTTRQSLRSAALLAALTLALVYFVAQGQVDVPFLYGAAP